MKYFQNSKYLELIKIIGENVNPINYSELKEKIGLADSTLSRSLNWLQNLDLEYGLKSKELDAFYLKKAAYIESTGIKKSKSNAFILTEQGIELFNSLFLESKEISSIDRMIDDFKIYEKLWNFIENNREIFYNQFDNELNPWTIQLFEFFEEMDEKDLNDILDAISGPINIKLYNLFELITSLIFTHPLWKACSHELNIDIPDFNESYYKLFNEINKINLKFQVFGSYPEIHCFLKSDKLIKGIHSLIEHQLKIFYWKGIKYYIHEEIIRKTIGKNVLDKVSENIPEYKEFLNKFHIEISIYIKNIIERICSEEGKLLRIPINLISSKNRKKLDYHLRRKIFLIDIEKIPIQLTKMGASKEIIHEKLEELIQKLNVNPDNYKIKYKLLELLVYNYSNELRTDLRFYERFKIDLIGYVENLINELVSLNSEYYENSLVLAYIFYNQKYLIGDKAIYFNELVLNIYTDEEVLYENLLSWYFRQSEWNIHKIKNLIEKSLELEFDNSFFPFSNTIVQLIEKKQYSNQKLKADITDILEYNDTSKELIQVINFFTIQLNKHELEHISLKLVRGFLKKVDDPELRWIHGEILLKTKKYSEAIEVFLKLIDVYPNKLFEGRILSIISNRFIKIPKLEEFEELNQFLTKIISFLNLVSKFYEWDIDQGDIEDFNKKRKEHLSTLRNELKKINLLLNNQFSLTIPLKIKAIILKALDRDKNLESCLKAIQKIAPNSIWANTEFALLLYKNNRYDECFRLLEFVNELKAKEPRSYSKDFFPFSYLLKEYDYNIFQLYMNNGKYNEAILLMEDYMLNPNSRENINIRKPVVIVDLINCYDRTINSVDKIIEKTLAIAEKLDLSSEPESDILNIKPKTHYIRQSLIDYLFRKKQFGRCLELIKKVFKTQSNKLDFQTHIFGRFNENKLYLALCYLELNNLILAKRYFEQSLEDLSEDFTLSGGKTKLLLIQPFPNYLLTNRKDYYLLIEVGLNRISKLLAIENPLEKLIFKTNIERSLGNISLLIKERMKDEPESSNSFQKYINSVSVKDRNYYELILACSYAITGYFDEMIKIIDKGSLEKSYPVVSSLLKVLYYYEDDFEIYSELNLKLHGLIPHSLVPLLLNLHFLRFKKGISKLNNIINLFKTVWKTTHKKDKIYGIEKQVFKYFKNNLIWYPFKWSLDVQRYIKDSEDIEINQIFEILQYIERKSYNQEEELLDFTSRILNADRRIPQLLSLILILRNYNYLDTKFFIYKLLKPELQLYELKTFGEIAYKANKLDEFLPLLDEYKNKGIKKYRETTFMLERNIEWLEERYVSFLLICFKHPDLDERILKSLKYLENLSDYPKEKMRYFKVLFDIRQGYYTDAELKAYQLIKWFKDDSELKWDLKYYNIWILSKLLSLLKENKELNPIDFFDTIEELLDFEKLKKDPIYFAVTIVDSLEHELLAGNEMVLFNFTEKLFTEIIKKIDWHNNKNHDIILEKIYFNRKLISLLSLKILNDLNKLIESINPKHITGRKYYLYLIKATILSNNGNKKEAREFLEMMFENLPDRFDYIRYGEINDYYLDLIYN